MKIKEYQHGSEIEKTNNFKTITARWRKESRRKTENVPKRYRLHGVAFSF